MFNSFALICYDFEVLFVSKIKGMLRLMIFSKPYFAPGIILPWTVIVPSISRATPYLLVLLDFIDYYA